MTKTALRKQIIAKRDAMDPKVRKEKDERIFEQLQAHPLFTKSQNIFIYIGYASEINTLPFIKNQLLDHKKVYIPFIDKKTNTMKITKLNNPEIELETGNYGILEMKKAYRQFADPNILDVIIMPGVAFDRKNHRLGYGGGYYDQFIAAMEKEIPLIALAYREQMVEEVPIDDHDIDMDFIITD